mmetsp:Transcript_53992/g.126049  ORF Transcript_53992/g.126049 Transcript_53992/m.126049 type:complete len:234 (+) Transcript_53992:1075-1776(+)
MGEFMPRLAPVREAGLVPCRCNSLDLNSFGSNNGRSTPASDSRRPWAGFVTERTRPEAADKGLRAASEVGLAGLLPWLSTPGSVRLLCMHFARIKATDFWPLSPSLGVVGLASGKPALDGFRSNIGDACDLDHESVVLQLLMCLVTDALCVPSPSVSKKARSLVTPAPRLLLVLGLPSDIPAPPRPFGEDAGDVAESTWSGSIAMRGRKGNRARPGQAEKLLFRLNVILATLD